MFEKHKMPSMETGLLIILVVISVFAVGLSTGEKVTGMVTAGASMPSATSPSTQAAPTIATAEEIEKANEKALALYRAMDGRGTDEKKIFTTLESVKNKEEMGMVESSFKAMTEGKTLDSRLNEELGGYEQTRALYLVEWAKSDKEQRGVEKAGKLIDYMAGSGTNEKAVKETLKGIGSQQEMEDIETAFQSMSGERLEDWIKEDMGGRDRAEALGYINTNKQRTANDVEYLTNYNINYLGLTKNADGSYSRAGYEGKYYIQEDGTVFYTGGKSPTSSDLTAQTLTKDGNWDTTQATPLKPIESIPKPQPTIDQSGSDFVAPTTADLDNQFKAAKKYWEDYKPSEIEVDVEQLGRLEGIPMERLQSIDWAQIRENAKTRQIALEAKSAEEQVKKAFVELVATLQEQDKLIAEKEWTEAAQLKSKINGLTELYKKASANYDIAYQKYDEMAYSIDLALGDLESPDLQTRKRAINKIEDEFYKAKTEEEKAEIYNNVNQIAERSSPFTEEATKLLIKLEEIEADKSLAASLGATYNPKDGSFTKNGKTGWAFTSDGEIDITVKKPVTTSEKEKLRTQYEDEIIKIHNQMHPYDRVERKEDGKLYDSNGNEVKLRYNTLIKDTEILERTPPKTINYNGIEQELTLLKDYKTINEEVLYQTKDGTIFSADTKWNDPNKQAFTGKISKTETIGDEKDPNSVLIRNWFDVNAGKKTSNTASASIINKDNPTIDNDIPIDKETLSMITKTVGAKGSIDPTKDGNSATISFRNKEGQETSTITFSPRANEGNYKIEGNKLTQGIRSQTDFAYTLDKNNDGEITEEEKEAKEYSQLTARFTAFEEDQGELKTTWYADNFRFGSDNIYFTDLYMQPYEKDDKGRNIPKGEPEYYYVEGGEKGKEDAGKIEFKRNQDGEIIAVNDGTKVIKVKDGKAFDTKTGGDISNTQEGGRAINREKQSTSKRWFSNFEFKLIQFKGLSGWSQLIFSDEDLAKWREGVDKIFSSLYLGTDYWVSGICSKHIPKQQTGTFMMKTKDGLFDVVAHVEGEKTTITGPEGTQYLYKLTYSVRNPKYSQYDKLKFNVYLYGDRTVQLYLQDIEVKDGDSFTRGSGERDKGQVTYDKQHGKPVVQYSPYNYNRICIRFNPGIINAKGKTENEICNAIVEYQGSPSEYKQRVTASGVLIPATPGEPYQEADF